MNITPPPARRTPREGDIVKVYTGALWRVLSIDGQRLTAEGLAGGRVQSFPIVACTVHEPMPERAP